MCHKHSLHLADQGQCGCLNQFVTVITALSKELNANIEKQISTMK